MNHASRAGASAFFNSLLALSLAATATVAWTAVPAQAGITAIGAD